MGEKPMMPNESSEHAMRKPFKMPHMPRVPIMPHRHVKEPFLYQHLLKMKGQRVEVATTCKTVNGVLKDVFPDHILVKADRRMYHIRLKTICFVSPLMDP